jgi:hypothetical protein
MKTLSSTTILGSNLGLGDEVADATVELIDSGRTTDDSYRYNIHWTDCDGDESTGGSDDLDDARELFDTTLEEAREHQADRIKDVAADAAREQLEALLDAGFSLNVLATLRAAAEKLGCPN